jgi:hypothetical protein
MGVGGECVSMCGGSGAVMVLTSTCMCLCADLLEACTPIMPEISSPSIKVTMCTRTLYPFTCMCRAGILLLSPAKHALHTPDISLRSVSGTVALLAS